jgi:hypothetical protein
VVQALPSSQTTGAVTQPVAGSHESVVQASPSLQTTGAVTQPVAVLHESVVQALPSLQTTGAVTQPVAGSHESVVQALPSSQTTAVPVQAPFWQLSPVVQALPSEQVVPSATGVSTQEPDAMSQEDDMQALLGVQTVLQQRLSEAVPRTTRVNTTPPKPGTASGTTWL